MSYYNHPRWPSPRAKIVAKNLELDYVNHGEYHKEKIKRITHAQALEVLRKKAGKNSVEEFLAMSEEDAWRALGCFYKSWYQAELVVYNPLYGPKWRNGF
jgi:hypothetical protein